MRDSSGSYFNVGTSREQSTEVSWSIGFANAYNKDKSTKLVEMKHTHFFNSNPSPGDRRGKMRFLEKYPNQNTEFKIDCRGCTFGIPRVTTNF